MRLDTSDRALLSLVGVFAIVYQAVLALAGNLFLELGGERLLPGHHIAAEVTVAAAMVLLVAAGGFVLARPHWRAARRVAAWADGRAAPLPDELRRLAAPLALCDRIVLVDDDEPTAFTVGARRPRVVVSRGLLHQASAPELAAILAHEAYHVHRHDPARRLLATVLCTALLHRRVAMALRDRVLAAPEFEADRRALEHAGRRPVAALYRLLPASPPPASGVASSMAGPELLAARVAQLETGDTPIVRIATRPWLAAFARVTLVVLAMDLAVGGLDPSRHWTAPAPVHGLLHVGPLWALWGVDRVLHRAS